MFGGVAGYRPRVRSVYYMRVYHHSSQGNVSKVCLATVQIKGQLQDFIDDGLAAIFPTGQPGFFVV
jgi:hypothetical protein